MELVPVSDLVPGLILELTGRQKLWDTSKIPWRELRPPARLRVVEISRMPSGANSDRVPYDLILLAPDGARIALEVADGGDCVAIVGSE